MEINGYIGENSPDTLIATIQMAQTNQADYLSITFPVPKDWYWKVNFESAESGSILVKFFKFTYE